MRTAHKLLLLLDSGQNPSYYVNTTTGSDSAAGTEDAPFATLFKAYDTLRTVSGGNGTIYVTAPESSPVNVETLSGQSGYLTFNQGSPDIKGYNGADWYLNIRAERYGSGWATGAAPIYSHAATGVGTRVFVEGLTDSDGEILELTINSGTPTTPAAGECGFSGGTLYVRLPADQNPNDSEYTVVYSRRNEAIVCAAQHVQISNCIARYGRGLIFQQTAGNLTLTDCELKYASNGVTKSSGSGMNTTLTCTDVVSNNHAGDNLHNDEGIVRFVRVTGRRAGDDGYSPHGNTVSYLTDCEFTECVGGGITLIDDSVGYLDNVTTNDNNNWGVAFRETSSGYYINSTSNDNLSGGGGSGKGFYCNTSGEVVVSGNTYSGNAAAPDNPCNSSEIAFENDIAAYTQVLRYKFQETSGTVIDNSAPTGAALDGTAANVTVGQMGFEGANEAASFNGSTSNVAASGTHASIQGIAVGTFYGLVNPTDAGETDLGRIFSKNGEFFLRINSSGGALRFQVHYDGTNAVYTTNETIDFGAYNTVIGKFNNTDKRPRIWLNGVEATYAGSIQGVGTRVSNSNALDIGSLNTTQTWNGLLDDVIIFSEEIPDAQPAIWHVDRMGVAVGSAASAYGVPAA